MSLLNGVNTGNKTTNSDHSSSNQINIKDEKFQCLTWMYTLLRKLFSCGRVIDDDPSHDYINSPILDDRPLSDGIDLLDNEILHGRRISSEDKQVLEDRFSPHDNNKTLLDDKSLPDDSMPPGNNHYIDEYGPNDAPSPSYINSPILDARPLSDGKSPRDNEILHGRRIPSEDKQVLEDRFSPHDNDKTLLDDKSTPDDSMPPGNNHYIDDRPLIVNKVHDNSLLLLPDDIIINILSRLSIDSDALQCRRVCRPLCEIMSNPSFTTMNLNRATPTFVLQPLHFNSTSYDSKTNLYSYDIVLHFIDEGKKRILKRRAKISLRYVPKKSFVPYLIGSYNGLLLFTNNSEGAFFIINPITQEQVLVKGLPYNYEVCGVYFHPPTSEYRILYMCSSFNNHHRFYILNPKSKSFREISNYTVAPCTRRYPVMLNGALHWMASIGDGFICRFVDSPGCSNSILVFNLDSEEFNTMPHPGSECCAKERQGMNVQLLEMEGHLCLCDTSISAAEVHVWVLENYRKRIWMKRHIIDIKSLSSEPFNRDYHGWPIVEALGIHNGEILVRLRWCDLYYYNVKLQTLRKVESVSGTLLNSVVVHNNSLASLQSESFISLEDLKICSTN